VYQAPSAASSAIYAEISVQRARSTGRRSGQVEHGLAELGGVRAGELGTQGVERQRVVPSAATIARASGAVAAAPRTGISAAAASAGTRRSEADDVAGLEAVGSDREVQLRVELRARALAACGLALELGSSCRRHNHNAQGVDGSGKVLDARGRSERAASCERGR
jgi:hypothetical protein